MQIFFKLYELRIFPVLSKLLIRVDAFRHFLNRISSVHDRPENTFNW